VLESYFQADVTVLREACRAFRRHFLQIVKVEVLLESMKITPACKKVFRKRFLQPDRIGIIPVGGYIDNRKQSRKAIAWLLHEEEGKRILHGRNGKERQLLNSQIYIWTASARRRAPCKSSVGATVMDIGASHSETYLWHVGAVPWPRGTRTQCLAWSE
jgi:hypothetical protein